MEKIISLLRTIFINILIIYLLLYILEIYFQTTNKNLFKETPYYKFKKITQKQKVVSMIKPTHIKDDHSNKIVPVSGISNVKTLLCYDGNKPIIYKSDSIGFDNENLEKDVDLILIGDSYAAGFCVDKENRFNHQFKKNGLKIINFGMGGNGPLIEFASLVEYSEMFNYDTIVWLFTPENDYENFEREFKNPILKKYLNPDFRQNLIKKNKEKDQLYYDYFKKKDRPIREFFRQYHLDLDFLREKIKNIDYKKKETNTFSPSYEAQTINSLNAIFKNLKNFSEKNNKSLFIVFNVLHPEILFNSNDAGLKDNIKQNKLFLEKEKINFFDFNDYIYNNYNKSNIDQIMKRSTGNSWDHYTNKGYSLLTEQIAIKIKSIKNK